MKKPLEGLEFGQFGWIRETKIQIFLHKYATQRRSQNTIWEIVDDSGCLKTIDNDIKEIACSVIYFLHPTLQPYTFCTQQV
jgi:hypothetical protein